MKREAQTALILTVGADLKVRRAGSGWASFGLAPRGGMRVQDVFRLGRVHLSVLDVLASGVAVDGVLIPLEAGEGGRVLCASLSPVKTGSEKPRLVVLRAYELAARLVIDEATERIVEANEAAAQLLGVSAQSLIGQPVGAWEALRRQGSESVWQQLTRKTTLYLGRFAHAVGGGRKVRIEAALLAPEAGTGR